MSERTRRSGDAPVTTNTVPTTETKTVAPATSNSTVQERLTGEALYEDRLGSKAGSFLYGLVEDNLSAEAIDGHASDGISSVAEMLGDLALDHASEEEMAAVLAFRSHLTGEIAPDIAARFAAGGTGENIADWAANSPWSMVGLTALAAAGYIASDQDLSFDSSTGLNDHTRLTFGGDFGTTLDPGFDAARLGLEYNKDEFSAYARGEHRFDTGDYSLGAGLSWQDERHRAYLDGAYESATDVGTLTGGLKTVGDDPTQWYTGFEADTNGRWNLGAGITHTSPDRDLEWFARAGVESTESGDTSASARVGLNWNF